MAVISFREPGWRRASPIVLDSLSLRGAALWGSQVAPLHAEVVVDLDQTDAFLVVNALARQGRAVAVCRSVASVDEQAPDFVVQETRDPTGELAEAGLAPGRRLSDVDLEAGTTLVADLAAVVVPGGHGRVVLPLGPAEGATDSPRLRRADASSDGDHVLLLLDDQTTERLIEREHWFHALVESAVDVIHVMDSFGVTRYITPGAADVVGYPREDLVGRHYRVMVDPRDQEHLDDAFHRTVSAPSGAVIEMEFRVRRRDGEVRWIHGRASNHLDTPGVAGIVANWRDITVPSELHSQLEYAASHDPLTELPNRSLFGDHLELALAGLGRRLTSRVGVVFCDLDEFKLINDSLGHAAGDDLLRQAARRLRQAVRPSDTVARLGGDAFAILGDGLANEHEAAALALRAQAAMSGSYRLAEASHDVYVGVSMGVSVSGDEPPQAETMLREADTALNEATRAGGNRVEVFSDRLRTSVVARLDLESGLRRAVELGQFVLHYQPKVDLRKHAVIEAEALLRWQHPTRGLLAPAEFLRVAEDIGLMIPIGRWVRNTAVAQVAAWAREGLHLGVCINLSARELTEPSLAAELAETMAAHGVEPGQVNLEITESAAVTDLDATIAIVAGLREEGVHVSLDDFGTGHSSLTWLQRLPVDMVKLDQTFTKGLADHSRTTEIVAAVLQLARSLGMETIGEGVESAEQLDRLTELGCDAAQGYHLGRPVPASELYAQI